MRGVGRRALGAVLIATAAVFLGVGCAGNDDGSFDSPTDVLAGRVRDSAGAGLSGVMITAYDGQRYLSVSVFTAGDGRYQFPPLDAGSYRVRARRIGFDEAAHDDVTMLALQGEPFTCAGWRMTDGPGQLAGAYLQEENDQAGDVANINVLDD